MKLRSSTRWIARLLGASLILAWLSITSNLLRISPDVSPTRPLRGAVDSIDDFVLSWKDQVRVNAQGDKIGPPRFILGIMSYESPSTIGSREFSRREMIRETYLRYYKDYGKPGEANRICGLHEIVREQIPAADCQIAYAFVLGQSAHPPAHNQTELLNASTTSEMVRPHTQEDVVLLDIVENGDNGKSPTWFRYATLLRRELNLPFDYVAKTDSDTLLIPPRFLRWVNEQEEQVGSERTRIYGGTPMDKVACGWPDHDHCENMTAPYFHGGGFYFASIDVSEYIVSDRCPRKDLFIQHEDVALGNYVHSMTSRTGGKPIVGFKNPCAYHDTWRHPVKDPKRIRSLWKHYLSKKKQRIKAKKHNASSIPT